MKQLLLIAFVFFLVIFTAEAQFTSNAVQSRTGNDISYTYEGVADSVDTLGYGKVISIANFNGALSTYPLPVTKIMNSAKGTPYVNIFVFGSYDNVTYFAVDTISYVDSVETRGHLTLDLNGKPVQYIKPWICGTKNGANTNNRDDSIFKFTIQLYKPD